MIKSKYHDSRGWSVMWEECNLGLYKEGLSKALTYESVWRIPPVCPSIPCLPHHTQCCLLLLSSSSYI